MAYLFDHLNQIKEVIQRTPFGLITDVDGTISPTAPTPQEAKVSHLCRQCLSQLSNKIALVATISGRPAIDAKNMLQIDNMIYFGNHGLERWIAGHAEVAKEVKDYPKIIKKVTKEITTQLSIEGLSIENKGVTATIHYRLSADPILARQYIKSAIASSEMAKRLRIMEGKMSINLLPPVAIDKGTIVLTLIDEYNLRGVIYLGDENTDLYAFRAIHTVSSSSSFQGFAIGVTSSEMPEGLVTEADFTLSSVSEVERFIQWLAQTVPELD